MGENEAVRIIEEYLQEFSKYLPEDNKEELIEELRTHLIDLASEDGPMTVESARRAIRIMGDPRKLAAEFSSSIKKQEKKTFGFSFRIGEKEYRFDFSIDENFAKMLYDFMYLLIVLVIISGVVRITYGLLYQANFSLIGVIVDVFASILFIVIIMHLLMVFFSYQPTDTKLVYRTKINKIVKKKKYVKVGKEENLALKASGLFFAGSFGILFGLVLAVFSSEVSSFTFVTMFFWMSIGLAIIFSGTIEILRAFYIVFDGRDSYFLETVKSFSSLFLIPAFFLIDIYTEDFQYIWLRDLENSKINSLRDFINHIMVAYIPTEYLVLAKIISIVLILLIFAYVIMVVLKYTSTRPKNIFEQ